MKPLQMQLDFMGGAATPLPLSPPVTPAPPTPRLKPTLARRTTPARQPAAGYTLTPGAGSQQPATYHGSHLAADLGFSEDLSGPGLRLCLWDAVREQMAAEGWERDLTHPATPEWAAEMQRRVRQIQICPDCPAAATCANWRKRSAVLAARQALREQGAPATTTAWALSFLGIKTCFEQYSVPLLPLTKPGALDIRDALRRGETVTLHGLRLRRESDLVLIAEVGDA